MIASADDTAIDLREGGGMSLTVEPSILTKAYGGRIVVDGLGLRIPEGSVYGFLGPNGSGKSTTMKMLLSLIRPTSGEVEVLGHPMTRSTRRQLPGGVGSLIETPPGYAHLTGAENMRIVQRLLASTTRRSTSRSRPCGCHRPARLRLLGRSAVASDGREWTWRTDVSRCGDVVEFRFDV